MATVTKLHENQRAMPENIEVEQAVLGALLMNNEAMYRVDEFLRPEHFYEPLHRKLYELIAALIAAGKQANPMTVKTFLPVDLDVAGMPVQRYLARLAAEATSILGVEDYGRTIYDLSMRRDLIAASNVIADVAYDAPVEMDSQAQIAAAEQQIFSLRPFGSDGGGFMKFGVGLTQSIDMAARAYQRDGGLSGLPTGLADLDRMTGGLQASDLVILAGRPGMGKTALATNIAYNLASTWQGGLGPNGEVFTEAGGIVGFFSLEMSAEQLATRILSEQTEIPSYRIRRGDIDPNDFDRLAQKAREIEFIPLYIDQAGGQSITQLAARARRLKRQRGLDVLVVDYIQLAAGSQRGRNNGRVQEVGEITTGLKALAKELNIPILALSQLSRAVENRDDKRPQLADLRESGSIEQDADVVLFVFREEYYLRNREPRMGSEEHFKWTVEMEKAHGKAEVIVGKQRHGPTGTIELQFNANVTRFSDLADSSRLPEWR